MAERSSEYIELLNGLKVFFRDNRLSPGLGDLEALITGFVNQLDNKVSNDDLSRTLDKYRTATQIEQMINAAIHGGSGGGGDEPVGPELEAEINRAKAAELALSNRITATENDISTLNGSGEGSVSAIAAAEVAKAIADAPESFDTLKEIADWISSHATSAAAMNSKIQVNAGNISELQSSVSDLATNGGGIRFGIVDGAYGYYDDSGTFQVFRTQADVDAAYQSGYDAGVAATKVGTATAERVLAGETFTNSSEVGVTGTMANRGSLHETINPGESYTIPKGYHSGAGSVSANPNQNYGTFAPDSRGAQIDMGINNSYRYVNTTGVPNSNSDTYTTTTKSSSLDMGEDNTYRYLDTSGIKNVNSSTYKATARNTKIDMGASNEHRYVNTSQVPTNIKLVNSYAGSAIDVNGYYYNSSGKKVTLKDDLIPANGNKTYTVYSDDYKFEISYYLPL